MSRFTDVRGPRAPSFIVFLYGLCGLPYETRPYNPTLVCSLRTGLTAFEGCKGRWKTAIKDRMANYLIYIYIIKECKESKNILSRARAFPFVARDRVWLASHEFLFYTDPLFSEFNPDRLSLAQRFYNPAQSWSGFRYIFREDYGHLVIILTNYFGIFPPAGIFPNFPSSTCLAAPDPGGRFWTRQPAGRTGPRGWPCARTGCPRSIRHGGQSAGSRTLSRSPSTDRSNPR